MTALQCKAIGAKWYFNTHCPICKIELDSTTMWASNDHKKQYCSPNHLPQAKEGAKS